MKLDIQIGDIIWSEAWKSFGLVLEEVEYKDEPTDYYVFIFDDKGFNGLTPNLKPKGNIVIHNEDMYGDSWWRKES